MKRLLIAPLAGILAATLACRSSESETPAKPETTPEPTAKSAPSKAAEDAPADAPTAEGGADAFAPPEDVAEPPEDAKRTESGLAYVFLKKGEGTEKPGPKDVVTVHYTGWTTDGKMFDSSRKRGKPTSFPLNRVIAGWTEGLQLVSPGDVVRLWIPEALAYKGKPGRPAGMLVFDVELLEFQKTPEVPENVAEAPDSAKTTDSGLKYVVLTEGEGEKTPSASSKVTVHYSGWTTDGKMFDSSVLRGSPATFPLSGVIPGWTEGLQLMTKGAKYRFWIPSKLAYEGKPGRPQGTLVFDVELLDFEG
jgi:peptidylprolyl isomerase